MLSRNYPPCSHPDEDVDKKPVILNNTVVVASPCPRSCVGDSAAHTVLTRARPSAGNSTILPAEHVDEPCATVRASSQPSSPVASDYSMPEDYTEPSTSTNRPYKPQKITQWSKEEQRLLVQMWCDHMTTSRSNKPKWKEIAARISIKRKITALQCQRKMKYLRDLYKEAKAFNEKHVNQPWEDRETSPYYHEIDSVLNCRRDAPHFNHVEETSAHTANNISASRATEVGPTANVSDVSVIPMCVPPRVFVENPEESGNSSFSTPARLAYWSTINRPSVPDTENDDRVLSGVQRAESSSPEIKDRRKRRKKNQNNSEDNDTTVFRETMEQLQTQGDRIATVLESMLKTQNQQVEMMTNVMNTFIQYIQRQMPKED